jgi:hypothetical protein
MSYKINNNGRRRQGAPISATRAFSSQTAAVAGLRRRPWQRFALLMLLVLVLVDRYNDGGVEACCDCGWVEMYKFSGLNDTGNPSQPKPKFRANWNRWNSIRLNDTRGSDSDTGILSKPEPEFFGLNDHCVKIFRNSMIINNSGIPCKRKRFRNSV